MNCPICNEYLYADEEWRLRAGFVPGTEEEPDNDEQAYAHARCLTANTENADGGT